MLTKRQVKRQYVLGNIFMGDALAALMFDHCMERGPALRYLEK